MIDSTTTILSLTEIDIYFLLIAIPTIFVGWFVEKHYVSYLSIGLTVVNLGTAVVSTPIFSIDFVLVLGFFALGLYVMGRDVKRQYQKLWVAFALGSKTMGFVTLYLGLLHNNWLITIFHPIRNYLEESDPSLQNLDWYTNIIGFFIILGFIHGVGLIITKKGKRKSKR